MSDQPPPSADAERRESLVKFTSVALTLLLLGLLTCLLLAWLVIQMPGIERINQGVIYNL